jgi:hypothetical protein
MDFQSNQPILKTARRKIKRMRAIPLPYIQVSVLKESSLSDVRNSEVRVTKASFGLRVSFWKSV